MKLYYLTDDSEKSLAPFFSKRVLDSVLAAVFIVGGFLVVFWSRRPLSEFIAAGDEPIIFFLVFAAALVVNSYVNLCCGSGDMVRKGYFIINYQTDKPTYEKEIHFYRYALLQFLLHALLLLLLFMPLLTLAAFSSAISSVTFMAALWVLYTTALICRLAGFSVYLWRGRSSTLGYFAARALMILFVFATVLLAPAINPLHILYRLNHRAGEWGALLAVYTVSAALAIGILILIDNGLVKRYINKYRGS